MRYPVKVYEVKSRDHKPELVKEFDVIASNLEAVRKAVQSKMLGLGSEMRSLSFSPNPEPTGSIVVYVKSVSRAKSSITRQAKPNSTEAKPKRPASIPAPAPTKKRRRS